MEGSVNSASIISETIHHIIESMLIVIQSKQLRTKGGPRQRTFEYPLRSLPLIFFASLSAQG